MRYLNYMPCDRDMDDNGDDYMSEAYGPTAEDAARCGVEEMIWEMEEDGSISREVAAAAFAKVADNPYTPFDVLFPTEEK
jgi:hypothetical protein